MDAAGARALAERIAQHQHWLQAEAVRTGAQPTADPDAHALEEFGDGYRLYRGEPGASPAGALGGCARSSSAAAGRRPVVAA